MQQTLNDYMIKGMDTRDRRTRNEDLKNNSVHNLKGAGYEERNVKRYQRKMGSIELTRRDHKKTLNKFKSIL